MTNTANTLLEIVDYLEEKLGEDNIIFKTTMKAIEDNKTTVFVVVNLTMKIKDNDLLFYHPNYPKNQRTFAFSNLDSAKSFIKDLK